MKKVRVGVIGVGYLGKFHAEKYAAVPQVELVGVVDSNKKEADAVAAKLKTRAFYSYEDILSKDKVDAVSIVVPTSLHHAIAKGFLSQGIDVLLEKPVTVTLEEADDLISEAKRNSAVLQIGHLERFNAAVTATEGIVKNPLFIESYRLSPFPNRSTDVDVVLDLMIHDIDIILNFVKSEIVSIDAAGIPVITDMVDMANARIRFQDGCVANVTASRVSKERMRKIRLFQHDCYLSIDYAHQNLAIFRKAAGKKGEPPQIVEEEMKIDKSDTLLDEIRAFIKSVVSREAPLVSGREGRRALEVAQMVQQAMGRNPYPLVEAHHQHGHRFL